HAGQRAELFGDVGVEQPGEQLADGGPRPVGAGIRADGDLAEPLLERLLGERLIRLAGRLADGLAVEHVLHGPGRELLAVLPPAEESPACRTGAVHGDLLLARRASAASTRRRTQADADTLSAADTAWSRRYSGSSSVTRNRRRLVNSGGR